MPLSDRTLQKLLRRGRDAFAALEEYDRTHTLSAGRQRLDITLDKRLVKRLREQSAKTGTPVSRLIEDALTRQAKRSEPATA